MNLLSNVQNMQNQMQSLSNEYTFLKIEKLNLHNYIDNRLDEDVRRDQEKLRHEREMFDAEKTRFAVYEVGQRSNLNALFFEGDERIKAVEMCKKLLDKREEEEQKREKSLKNTKTDAKRGFQKL